MSIDNVEDIEPRVQYVAAAAQTAFDYPFPIFQDADIVVDVDGVTQTLTTDYTVTGEGEDTGGTVTFLVAMSGGEIVTIYRDIAIERTSDFQQNGPLRSSTFNDELDRVTLILQQLESRLGRSLRLPITGTATAAQAEFSPIANWLSKYVTINASGVPEPATIVTGTISQSIIASLLNPTTLAEQNAGVTPTNHAYLPGNVLRYGATGDGVSDDIQAIQDAVDSCTGSVYFPTGQYKISRPILIRSDSFQNLAFVGESRTSTYLMPMSVDISTAPQSVNTLIFNQSDNGKFSISNMRFQSDVAYTGISIYCVDGGGGDASGEAMFSGSIENCWFGMSSQNTGVLRGGLSNYVVRDCVFEFAKGCFFLEGAGNGDIIFQNCQLFFCFDAFIDGTADTDPKNLVVVNGVNAYAHARGPLIKVQNGYSWKISNVSFQSEVAAPGVGAGLFWFKDSFDIIANGFSAYSDNPFGTGTITTGITLEACIGAKFASGYINGADVGILLTGTSENDISIDNVDIVNSTTAAFRVLTGAPTGRVAVSDSNWADAQERIILFSNAAAFNFFASDCSFVNAGLSGNTGARNLVLNTSGLVHFRGCIIGRNDAGAAATHFVEATGAGSVILAGTHILGVPPTAVSTGSQTVEFFGRGRISETTVASAASITLPFDSDFIAISGTANITSITATNCGGRLVTLVFSGGLSVVDGSNLRLASNFSTGANATLTLRCDGSNWFEVARSTN
ncbi:MAG: glycosyl hydrolase family 28-related protein [Steroidobacteraceae bacterium]